jgi:DNA-binding transcriptional MerR regulator
MKSPRSRTGVSAEPAPKGAKSDRKTSPNGTGAHDDEASAERALGAAPDQAVASGAEPAPIDAERAKRNGWFTTGEMARLTSNTLRTVRFYEEAGILQPVGRTEGGHRLFERAQLDRLLLVSDMREAGFSLDEIRNLLETKSRASSGAEAASEATLALKGRMQKLRAKIEVLTRLHEDLSKTIEAAGSCLDCESEQFFPDRCGECTRIDPTSPPPRGMRVLWSIQHRPQSGG